MINDRIFYSIQAKWAQFLLKCIQDILTNVKIDLKII